MAYCGVLDEEQARRQPFEINAQVWVDLRQAGQSDDLNDTINYGVLGDNIEALVASGSHGRNPQAPSAHGSRPGGIWCLHHPNCRQTRVTMAARRAFLGLGSNLGERLAYLRTAVQNMPDVAHVSSLYETDPVGGPEQGAFLNCVVELHTELTPRELLELCRTLEADAERVRIERWGPRTLDVDVVYVDGETVDEPDLIVPHPRWRDRAFVMIPLGELAPDLLDGWIDPDQGEVRNVGTL